MIHYKKELQYYEQHIKTQSLGVIQHYLNELKKKLLRTEQYQEVCHVYFLKMTHYYWYGQTVRALKIYLENRTFIEQYASKSELIQMRYASCLLLDTLGFYKDNFATMLALKKEAEALDLHDLKLDTLNNLGYYYELDQKFDEAKHYYQECMTFYETQSGFTKNVSYLLAILNISHVYLKQENSELAAYYLTKFEQLEHSELVLTEIIYIIRKVRLHMLNGDLKQAVKESENYLAYDLESMEFHLVLGHLATIVILLERIGDSKKVIEVLERSIVYANKLKSHSIQQYSLSLFQAVQESDLMDDLKKDVLTGALTRASFDNHVGPLLGLRESMLKVFAIIDVDYFKQINDQYGHLIGDEILKTIAARARHYKHPSLQSGKHVFGRYGGDEFYLFFEVTTEKQAEVILQDFHLKLTAGDYRSQNLIIPMSVTMGATYSTATNYPFERWLKKADNLLYKAKNQQRGILIAEKWGQLSCPKERKCGERE